MIHTFTQDHPSELGGVLLVHWLSSLHAKMRSNSINISLKTKHNVTLYLPCDCVLNHPSEVNDLEGVCVQEIWTGDSVFPGKHAFLCAWWQCFSTQALLASRSGGMLLKLKKSGAPHRTQVGRKGNLSQKANHQPLSLRWPPQHLLIPICNTDH